MIDKYVTKDGKKLRLGYTTGSCATGAAKAAAIMLLGKTDVNEIELMTLHGTELYLKIEDIKKGENYISCAITKDAGDDPDATNGLKIHAKVKLIDNENIVIDGGLGVGRVTKPGLNQPVGNAAINSGPRKSIEIELLKIKQKFEYQGGFEVEIFVPSGEEISKKTYNSRLGIVGGISIIGSTGIVEPMSEDALIKTIHAEIDIRFVEKKKYLIISPGNYGRDFVKEELLISSDEVIKCSNFIGETITYAASKGFKGMLLIGHGGKLIKLAGGMFNTHSKYGDCRALVIGAYAAIYGADKTIVENILNSVTVDEMLNEAERAGVAKEVLNKIIEDIEVNLKHKAGENLVVEAMIFTNQKGMIAMTSNAEVMLRKIVEEK